MNRFAFLLRELVARDLRGRYAGSLFGFFWAFLHPVWQLVLYSLVFSVILRIPLVGERTTSFAAFLFAGLLPWLALQEGIARGATAITENGQLVKKLSFPSEILVFSVVVSALVHAAIAFAVFTTLQAWRGELTAGNLPWLLIGLLAQLPLTAGLALAVAAYQVYVRDVVQGLGLVLSAIFYVTPIVYPVALVPARLHGLVTGNPLATVVACYRSFLLGSEPPAGSAIAVLLAVAALVLAAGLTIFRRLAPGFADEL